jgi:endonuclease/exonuclease/phosphatase family metal-dependent hydrolase
MNKRLLVVCCALLLLCGCGTVRKPIAPTGPHFSVITYNINRGSNPAQIAAVLKSNQADIICLQEADGFERPLRAALSNDFRTIEFRDSDTRVGGEYAFLSKYKAREIAWIDSETGWFGGWIMSFETPIGPVQVLNVHLKPPVSRRGSWVVGYFTTRDDRRREMEHFYKSCDPNLPLIVLGDFNDSPHSASVRYLKRKHLQSALPQFDRRTPTWYWPTHLVTLRRRMDHILFSPKIEATSARVIPQGPSDHFPVEATFVKAAAQK